MKLILPLILALSLFGAAQVHTFPAEDTNNVFTGTNQFQLGTLLGPVTFSALPTESNGTQIYCSDCQQTNPCIAGGTGAMGAGIAGVWNCLGSNGISGSGSNGEVVFWTGGVTVGGSPNFIWSNANGGLSLAANGTGVALNVTSDVANSDIQDWFVYGAGFPGLTATPDANSSVTLNLLDSLGHTASVGATSFAIAANGGSPQQIVLAPVGSAFYASGNIFDNSMLSSAITPLTVIASNNSVAAFRVLNHSNDPLLSVSPAGLSVIAFTDRYGKLRCETGLGDGLNAMAAGTYLQSMCYNDSGVTWTITGIKCFTDNNGTSTLNAAGNTLGALLSGAVTCTNSFATASQSANVALTSGDYIKFTFVADGTSKQTTWVVSMTQ